MFTKVRCTAVALVAAAGLVGIAVAQAPKSEPAKTTPPAAAKPTTTQPSKDAKPAMPAGHADNKGMPAGMPEMTPEQMKMMQACMEAGTPGEMHEKLAKAVGTWNGKCKMWMSPDAKEPTESTCTTVFTTLMDGRYLQCDTKGDMGGMPFHGMGTYAYDNVSKKFQCTWIDSMSTGIMFGTGEQTSDGKTTNWSMTYNCPVTKKPTVMREIDRHIDDNHMTLEMHGVDPMSGKEFKMMEIAYTRAGAAKKADATKTTTPSKGTTADASSMTK